MAQKTKRCRRRNKLNSYINGEYGAMKKWGKRMTASVRRLMGKKEIKDRLENE